MWYFCCNWWTNINTLLLTKVHSLHYGSFFVLYSPWVLIVTCNPRDCITQNRFNTPKFSRALHIHPPSLILNWNCFQKWSLLIKKIIIINWNIPNRNYQDKKRKYIKITLLTMKTKQQKKSPNITNSQNSLMKKQISRKNQCLINKLNFY